MPAQTYANAIYLNSRQRLQPKINKDVLAMLTNYAHFLKFDFVCFTCDTI
jgi:hypothetical protein